MENFSNQEIDYLDLPAFEKVNLQGINPNYFKVILINIGITFVLLALGLGILFYLKADIFPNTIWFVILTIYTLALAISVFFSRLNFKFRGFVFREQDAIYKEGVLSQSTTIVPYKRVQHVALHQGLFSRYFGLASIELFTAGGSSTDLEISGLTFEEAQKYKLWIVQKIDTLVEESEEIKNDSVSSNDNLNQENEA